jgi:hypothetical protein
MCKIYIIYNVYNIGIIFVGLVCIGMHEDTHVIMSPRPKGLVLKMEHKRSGWTILLERSWPASSNHDGWVAVGRRVPAVGLVEYVGNHYRTDTYHIQRKLLRTIIHLCHITVSHTMPSNYQYNGIYYNNIWNIYVYCRLRNCYSFFVMYLKTCFGSYEPSSGEVRVYKCYRN